MKGRFSLLRGLHGEKLVDIADLAAYDSARVLGGILGDGIIASTGVSIIVHLAVMRVS